MANRTSSAEHVSAPERQVSPWLVAEFVESYACWREESTAVRSAYEHWASAEARDRALASAAYRAALDREEHAAREHRECAERVARRTD